MLASGTAPQVDYKYILIGSAAKNEFWNAVHPDKSPIFCQPQATFTLELKSGKRAVEVHNNLEAPTALRYIVRRPAAVIFPFYYGHEDINELLNQWKLGLKELPEDCQIYLVPIIKDNKLAHLSKDDWKRKLAELKDQVIDHSIPVKVYCGFLALFKHPEHALNALQIITETIEAYHESNRAINAGLAPYSTVSTLKASTPDTSSAATDSILGLISTVFRRAAGGSGAASSSDRPARTEVAPSSRPAQAIANGGAGLSAESAQASRQSLANDFNLLKAEARPKPAQPRSSSSSGPAPLPSAPVLNQAYAAPSGSSSRPVERLMSAQTTDTANAGEEDPVNMGP
jgi:hypothetical protein